jgi:hypothetical protein
MGPGQRVIRQPVIEMVPVKNDDRGGAALMLDMAGSAGLSIDARSLAVKSFQGGQIGGDRPVAAEAVASFGGRGETGVASATARLQSGMCPAQIAATDEVFDGRLRCGTGGAAL